MDNIVLSVSDFVGLLNQTLEYVYPNVVVQGELANYRVSKNKWVYFDLKDEYSSVKFFGTVYQLPGPLEDGMLLQVRGTPRLHNLYGFNVNVLSIQPIGEGSIKKASVLLEAKLAAEGLFGIERKRLLPYPPKKIGLITSAQSAAYHDFIKILNQRWVGTEVLLADVQVQGEVAPAQIVTALNYINTYEDVDVIVLTRGGGSVEDLAAFSTEQVTRAIAGSRTPTLVAIGHEVDISLGELAADKRASTPSNAAELLVPDKKSELARLQLTITGMADVLIQKYEAQKYQQKLAVERLHGYVEGILMSKSNLLKLKQQVLHAFNPSAVLARGFAVVRSGSKVIKSVTTIKKGDELAIQLLDGSIKAKVE